MEESARKELERAKALFYNWRLAEAYQILRRFYDRIPFKFETEHAEYIGIFTRTLLELGKEFELKFYLSELETLYKKWQNPEIGYPLAIIYSDSKEANLSDAKKLLQYIISHSSNEELVIKAKMRLAYCYDVQKDDTASCRKIIDSITDPKNPDLKVLHEIWKAKLLRDEGKDVQAEKALHLLLKQVSPRTNWYAHFSAILILARLHLKNKDYEKAQRLTLELKNIFEKHHFKCVNEQINVLYADIEKHTRLGTLQVQIGVEESVLSYNHKSVKLEGKIISERLLLQLVKKKFIAKASIVKTVHDRPYSEKTDDAFIYNQIHTIRKILKKVGLPSQAILVDGNGYRFVPEVKLLEGET